MAHATYIREKARSMRVERKLTIGELAQRLALPRTTIYYWVRDLPLSRAGRANRGQRRGNRVMRERYRALREDAYKEGLRQFDEFAVDPSFRDFVCLYLAEGYKRNRNRVSLCNSDSAVVQMATRWMGRLTDRQPEFSVQYHADQDLSELCRFWGETLGIDPSTIRAQRKSNSNQLNGRQWRSRHGVLTVCVNDTLFRARLEAWMHRLRASWL
jgi:AcrR family transcriptional regulator